MGFLAGFYGAQATSHQETTQAWKRMWQADEQLRQQDEQLTLDTEYRQQDLQIRREAAAEGTRQFNANEEIARAGLAHQRDQLDADYASTLMTQLQPVFDDSSRLSKYGMVDSLRQSVGDNRFTQGYIDALEASINTQPMSVADARETLTQGFQGVIRDANGNLWMPPDVLMEEALSVMEAESPSQGALWRAEWDAKKEAIASNNEYMFDAQRAGINLANLSTEAGIRNLDADTSFSFSRTLTEDQQRQHASDLFTSTLASSEYGAQLMELEVEDKTARLAVLEDYLAADYAQMLATVESLERGNEFELTVFNDMVKKVAHETQLAESQVRVAMATEEFTIRGAELEVDRAGALIAQIEKSTDMLDEQRNDSLLSLGLSMAEAGNTEVLEALGEQFFGHIEGWEDVMGPLVAMSSTEQTDRRTANAAQTALLQNQAAHVAEQTSVIRYDSETRRLQVHSSLSAVSGAVRGDTPVVYMSRPDAHTETRLATQFTLEGIQTVREEAVEMDSGIQALLRVQQNSGNSSALVQSLEGMLKTYGITPPTGATGQWTDEAIAHAIVMLEEKRNNKEAAVATQMSMYYDLYGSLTGHQETVDEVFRLQINPETQGTLGAEGQEFSSSDTRIYQSIVTSGPGGNVGVLQGMQNAAETEAFLETFGGGPELVEFALGTAQIALADIAANSPHGAFLGMDLATQIFEDFLADDRYGGTEEERKALFRLVGWNSPNDVAHAINDMRADILEQSNTVYNYQGSPIFRGATFDVSTSSGLNHVFSQVSGAEQSLDRAAMLGREVPMGGYGTAEAEGIAALFNDTLPALVSSGVLTHTAGTPASGPRYFIGANYNSHLEGVRGAVDATMAAATRLRTVYGNGVPQ